MSDRVAWTGDYEQHKRPAVLEVEGGFEPVIQQGTQTIRSRNHQVLSLEDAKRAALELRDKVNWLQRGVVARLSEKGITGLGPFVQFEKAWTEEGRGWAVKGVRFFSIEWLNPSLLPHEVQGCVLKHFIPHRLSFFLAGVRIGSTFYQPHRQLDDGVFSRLAEAQDEAVRIEQAVRSGDLYRGRTGGLLPREL